MKIVYKNFVIEEDTYWYVLSEMWVIKDKESKNLWEEYIINQVYPATFEKAIEWLIKRLNARSKEILELRNYVTEFKKINDEFLKDISKLIKA